MPTQVQLFFRGENLADTDTFSKSDPYCVLEEQGQGGGWTEVGRTECIDDDLNPKFSSSIGVDYHFGRTQNLRLKIFDEDGNKNDEDNDKLGSCEFLLQNILKSKNGTLIFALKPQGKMFITGTLQEMTTTGKIELCFGARSLHSIDFVGKAPYFKISKSLPNGAVKHLYTSQPCEVPVPRMEKSMSKSGRGANTLANSRNTHAITASRWEPVTEFLLSDICTDVRMPSLLFEAFASQAGSANGNLGHGAAVDQPCGSFLASIANLQEVAADPANRGIKLKDAAGKRHGEVFVTKVGIDHAPSFTEFLKSGFEINLAIAIDFAGCNPDSPKSLHYMGSPMGGAPFMNQFARSVLAVGETLLPYDSDQLVPVYGFGAVPTDCEFDLTSDFFHCNGNKQNPEVQGMDGVLDAYRVCADTVKQGDASNFSQTIEDVAKMVRTRNKDHSYTILLIITDGNSPSDMDETVDAIIEASDAPMSIVIVGVGTGSFTSFEFLDGDRELLRSERLGKSAARDIVQFVPFKKYEKRPAEDLAAAVLEEIPEQFCGWATVAGLTPAMVERHVAAVAAHEEKLEEAQQSAPSKQFVKRFVPLGAGEQPTTQQQKGGVPHNPKTKGAVFLPTRAGALAAVGGGGASGNSAAQAKTPKPVAKQAQQAQTWSSSDDEEFNIDDDDLE